MYSSFKKDGLPRFRTCNKDKSSVFRIHSKIEDEIFLRKKLKLQTVYYFYKKLHLRYWSGFWIHIWTMKITIIEHRLMLSIKNLSAIKHWLGVPYHSIKILQKLTQEVASTSSSLCWLIPFKLTFYFEFRT